MPRPGRAISWGGAVRAMRAASCIAAIMEPGSARFLPAMSKAVPWSGLVRTVGRPTVTFTAWSR